MLYLKGKNLILDQLTSSGATLVKTKLFSRNNIGFYVNDKDIKISKKYENLSYPIKCLVFGCFIYIANNNYINCIRNKFYKLILIQANKNIL